ncbi:MAG: hypothetical protein HY263_01180 [Chloroflexi bacterium]|nr:hypothetical protein [Chloroflexota bacterium]
MDFLRRRGGGASGSAGGAEKPAKSAAPAASRPIIPEEVNAEDHQVRLSYAAKSSEGVRLGSGREAKAELAGMIGSLAKTPVEVVDPREMDTGQASPSIIRTAEAQAWLAAHGSASPITRHALFVLEMLDAIDPAYETFACALLDGSTDPAGYPDFSAVVGGVAAHWDESTGDLIVRAIVAWGGRGTRGDTDREATRILSALFRNILESGRAMGLVDAGRPMIGGGLAVVSCPHCGFSSAGQRALYCPKCGMRMVRG